MRAQLRVTRGVNPYGWAVREFGDQTPRFPNLTEIATALHRFVGRCARAAHWVLCRCGIHGDVFGMGVCLWCRTFTVGNPRG